MQNSFSKTYKLVQKIPKGKVVTYGTLAKLIGTTPRVIGFALHANKNPDKVPCHRVVFADGKLSKGYAFGGSKIQMKLLKSEGIGFINERVNLEKYLAKLS